jgi:hypothetical protein
MKYAVDRIEDSFVILENIKTKEIIKEDISNLPKGIKEGTILIKRKTYKVDYKTTSKRKIKIRNKFNKLKN